MITIKMYGMMRLKTGIKEITVDIGTESCKRLSDVFPLIIKHARENNPELSATEKDLKNCVIMINGQTVRKGGTKLASGDLIVFLSPAGGG